MRVQRRAFSLLPPDLASRINIPGRTYPAFNGQRIRREIVEDIARHYRPDRVIETGTWRGGSTALLADIFAVPVATVDADARFHAFAKRRLADRPQVWVERDDSRAFLCRLAHDPDWSGRSVFAYLDAHWERDLPLAAELRIIAATWERAVVMIDDFQVPDDPGYGYDDYGPDVGALTEEILPECVRDWRVLHPAAPASEETGRRRGCCVLISPALAELNLDTLTPGGSWVS